MKDENRTKNFKNVLVHKKKDHDSYREEEFCFRKQLWPNLDI